MLDKSEFKNKKSTENTSLSAKEDFYNIMYFPQKLKKHQRKQKKTIKLEDGKECCEMLSSGYDIIITLKLKAKVTCTSPVSYTTPITFQHGRDRGS